MAKHNRKEEKEIEYIKVKEFFVAQQYLVFDTLNHLKD